MADRTNKWDALARAQDSGRSAGALGSWLTEYQLSIGRDQRVFRQGIECFEQRCCNPGRTKTDLSHWAVAGRCQPAYSNFRLRLGQRGGSLRAGRYGAGSVKAAMIFIWSPTPKATTRSSTARTSPRLIQILFVDIDLVLASVVSQKFVDVFWRSRTVPRYTLRRAATRLRAQGMNGVYSLQ